MLTLVVIGPLFFLFAMIYAHVGLELLMVIFRIHEDVRELNQRAGGVGSTSVPIDSAPVTPSEAGPSVAPA